MTEERECVCIKPKAVNADLWKNVGRTAVSVRKGILVEVEHLKAHRTKKEKKDMSHFEKFVTEGIEKADELAKEGAFLDEGFVAEARAKTLQQEKEEVYVVLQYSARFHWLGRTMEGL